MSRGVGLPITMAGGSLMEPVGRGGQARWPCIRLTTRSGRRHMFPSSDSEAASDLESVSDSDLASVRSDGFPAVLATGITRGMGAGAGATTRWISITQIIFIADGRRFEAGGAGSPT